jgi:hypothetical protein
MNSATNLLGISLIGVAFAFLACTKAPKENVKSIAAENRKEAERKTIDGVISPSNDSKRTFEVGGMKLQIDMVQLGETYADEYGGKGVPQGKRDNQLVLGMRINVLTGDAIRVLKEFQPWITDGTGATVKIGYGRADTEKKTVTILFAVPKTEKVFHLHFSDTVVIDMAPLLKGEK